MIQEDQDQYMPDLDEFEQWFLTEIADTVKLEPGCYAPMAYRLCVSQICRNLWEQNKQLKAEIECMKNRLIPLKVVYLGEETGHAD